MLSWHAAHTVAHFRPSIRLAHKDGQRMTIHQCSCVTSTSSVSTVDRVNIGSEHKTNNFINVFQYHCHKDYSLCCVLIQCKSVCWQQLCCVHLAFVNSCLKISDTDDDSDMSYTFHNSLLCPVFNIISPTSPQSSLHYLAVDTPV